MINIQQFKQLQKNSHQSYQQQKALIKKVLAGKTVFCEVCKQPLQLRLPEQYEQSGIFCHNGCTEIQLELEGC